MNRTTLACALTAFALIATGRPAGAESNDPAAFLDQPGQTRQSGGQLEATPTTAEPTLSAPGQPRRCHGDATGDGRIDVDDMIQVFLDWGPARTTSDFTGDDQVDIDDMIVVFMNWGLCP